MRFVRRQRPSHRHRTGIAVERTIECGGTLAVTRYESAVIRTSDDNRRISVLDDGYHMINLNLSDALDVAAAIVQLCGDDITLDAKRHRIAAEIEDADLRGRVAGKDRDPDREGLPSGPVASL